MRNNQWVIMTVILLSWTSLGLASVILIDDFNDGMVFIDDRNWLTLFAWSGRFVTEKKIIIHVSGVK